MISSPAGANHDTITQLGDRSDDVAESSEEWSGGKNLSLVVDGNHIDEIGLRLDRFTGRKLWGFLVDLF